MSLRLRTAARTEGPRELDCVETRKIKTAEDDDLLTVARALTHRLTPRYLGNGKCFELCANFVLQATNAQGLGTRLGRTWE